MKKLSYISITALLLCVNNLNSAQKTSYNELAKNYESAEGVAKHTYKPTHTIKRPVPKIVSRPTHVEPPKPFEMDDIEWESLPSRKTVNPEPDKRTCNPDWSKKSTEKEQPFSIFTQEWASLGQSDQDEKSPKGVWSSMNADRKVKSWDGMSQNVHHDTTSVMQSAIIVQAKEEKPHVQPSKPFEMDDIEWESLPSRGTTNPAQSGQSLWPAYVQEIAEGLETDNSSQPLPLMRSEKGAKSKGPKSFSKQPQAVVMPTQTQRSPQGV